MIELTAEVLRELLDYNPETGVFFWRRSRGNGVKVGQLAGSMANNGYWQIAVQRRVYRAHRLAWLHYYGEWPSAIDHINGVRVDNRIVNLRQADGNINEQNRVCAGAFRCRKKWQSRIRTNGGKREYLGTFDTREEAEAAYLAAKRQHHAGFVEARYIDRAPTTSDPVRMFEEPHDESA